VFPQTLVQTCIVHLVHNSMGFASWKDRKAIAGGFRGVYRTEMAWLPWMPLRRGHGAGNIRPSRKAGAGIGTR
jgi:hypothetical protein